MNIIVLLTDFGGKDEYVGVMKGVINSINPEVKIVDLCHEIPPQNIIWAGYVLYKSYKYFPEETIFLCVVDPGVGTKREIIILRTDNYYFIAPDNGLLSLVYKNSKIKKTIRVNKDKFSLKPVSFTFHGRDIFAPIAGYLSKRKKIDSFGQQVQKIKIVNFPKPSFSKCEIKATVIHIDRFGNLITNLKKDEFQKLRWANFKIFIKNRIITEIVNCYAQDRDLVAVWESRDLLEIASPNSSAENILKAKVGDTLRIVKV